MTRTNFENELLTAWDEATANLTPEEREAMAQATAKEWITAITELITDRNFWMDMLKAFLNGMARGR